MGGLFLFISTDSWVLFRGYSGHKMKLNIHLLIAPRLLPFWRSQARASSCDSNNLTNQMQLFFTSLILDVHMWLNMLRASPRPSSGAYSCTRSLWFYLWKETAGSLLVVVWPARPRPTTLQPFPSKGRLEAPSAVLCSWWWEGRRPKHVEPHMNVE
jgi:hypothetical protein